MDHDLDKSLLRPGQSVTFEDRDHLLKTLDELDQQVPARHEGRKRDHREHSCMVHYLIALAGQNLLPLPVILRKLPENQDPPDFALQWPGGREETFELTDGSTEEYQRRLTAASRLEDHLVLPVDINTPTKEATQLWADILFSAFLKKAEALRSGGFDLDHLLIYDLTGLGLLLPLEQGAPILRQRVQEWYAKEAPGHRFGRVSILRDLALFLDLEGEGRILRLGESPYFRLPVIRAHDEDDLRMRLREIDSYCRSNSIRHLKPFGSILGDRDDLHEESDLDLLVEFERGARVTLLDMARMERELGALIGFKVDLRTVADLSRYFRHEVLQEAVEWRATR